MLLEASKRIALVTDAATAVGNAVAVELARLDIDLVLHVRCLAQAAPVMSALSQYRNDIRVVAADLSLAGEAHRLAAEAGPVDILINHSGACECRSSVEVPDSEFSRHISIDLHAPFILVRRLAPQMAARGGGSIVNVSTIGASVAVRGCGVYGAAKAGIELLTRTWASELSIENVRVNAVSTGLIREPGGQYHSGVGFEGVAALGRAADPLEVASVIAFLNTPAATYINGAIIHVNGGLPALPMGLTRPGRSPSADSARSIRRPD